MKIDRVKKQEKKTDSLTDQQASSTSVQEDLDMEKAKEQALIKTMMEREAEWQRLTQTNKQLQKNNNHIRRSRTWKLAAPIRKITSAYAMIISFFRTFFKGSVARQLNEQKKQLQAEKQVLETENHTIREELKMKQEQMRNLTLESDNIDSNNLHYSAKNAKENGEIIHYIHHLIQQKETTEANYSAALLKAARLFNKEQADYKEVVYSEVLPGLNLEDIPEFIVRFSEAENTLNLKEAASFSASLTMRARLRQLKEHTPEQNLDNKVAAYKLMDSIDIQRPWMAKDPYRFADIPRKDETVIKPLHGAGSRGVYLVYNEHKIQDVKRSRILTSWQALEASIQEDLASGWIADDEWIVEELMIKNNRGLSPEPATDFKFYCFYGKVALILEINRFPEIRYCWWTPDGERISTGKYDDVLFKGEGISIEDIEDARSISAKLPVPFIRIDFLKTDQGMVFGEFTPKPGNYEAFNRKTDQWLGNYYLDAEGRLTEDLINGKQFNTYHNWIAQLNREKELFI